MSTYNRRIRLQIGPNRTGLVTGVAGTTLKYEVLDNAGATLVALTAGTIAESPAGTGEYMETVATWSTEWVSGVIRWWIAAGTVFLAQEEFNETPLAALADAVLTRDGGLARGQAASGKTPLLDSAQMIANGFQPAGAGKIAHYDDHGGVIKTVDLTGTANALPVTGALPE